MSAANALKIPAHRPRRRSGVTIFRPDDYAKIMGATFIKHEHQPLLTIGSLHFDRWHLGSIGCPHPVAAIRLNRVIQTLKITSLSELAARIDEVRVYGGLGITAYAVVLTILQEAGYEPLLVHSSDVTYGALKTRALKLAEKDSPRRRRRRRG
jgi:hypothetical protein